MDEQIGDARFFNSQTGQNALEPFFSGDQRKSFPPGQTIDNRLRVIRELGRGGTGTVYEVEQFLLKRRYAMKVLDPLQVSDEAWRRFQKEAQAAGRLDHVGFVKVHDFGLLDNQIPYFTMDLVAGETLSQRLRSRGPLTVEQALPIFIQLCFALDYAHSQGVIHRDLKPSNISLTHSDTENGEQVKILDFGIAKLVDLDTTSLTKVGAVFGTPFYMSPEQCLEQRVDHRSDIYSLGCVFFELLAGAPPFTSEQALSLMMQHQSEKPPTLKEVSVGGKFPPALENLIQKMLAKKPEDRYQRLTETASDLMQVQQGKSPTIVSSHNSENLPAKAKTPALLTAGAVLVSIIAIAGASFFGYQKFVASRQEEREEAKPLRTIADTTNVLPSGDDAGMDDLFVSSPYFSTPTNVNGISYRVFNFPVRTQIAQISYTDLATSKKVTKPARGTLTVPCNPGSPCIGVKMLVQTCSKAPQLLKKFRPDEVGYLSFEDNDMRKSLGADDIYDNTLAFVDDLKSVFSMDLPVSVSNASIPHIAKLPRLVALFMSRTQITGDALSKLPQLPHLRLLAISMVRNAKDVLPALRHSQELDTLKMAFDELTDADLKNLSKILTLRELILRGNSGITDAGLTYIAHLPNLHNLILDGCNITPKSIKTLSKMKIHNAVSLDVSKWSKADIDKLFASVPYDVLSWNRKLNRYVSLRHPSATEDDAEKSKDTYFITKEAVDRGD